jgi:uncharacterized protein (TIRG00374 family)
MMDDTETPAPPNLPRRLLVLLFKIIVSAGLLAFLFSRMDLAHLGAYLQRASFVWLATALGLYAVVLLVNTWRWQLLLHAQHIDVPASRLMNSYLVATFFNNFLPSNIGGDVVRIRDTASRAGSKTLATTIVLMDRGLGLLGLFLVGAIGATVVSAPGPGVHLSWVLWLVFLGSALVAMPIVLVPEKVGRLLSPLRVFHQEWVDERIARFTAALGKFGSAPRSLLACFSGAVVVQFVLVGFYVAIVHSMNIPVPAAHLAVIVPLSFVVQMLPVSVNGFGVREATFSFYFTRLGLPIESAVIVSLVGAGLIIIFSLSGAIAYIGRPHRST